ncbi:MAG: hypothetical protein ROO76_09860 [Terriglobia bacterium]|nr:hypothetical protein [Terriglobia bacterium]
MRIELTDQELDLVNEVMQLHQETLLRDIARTDHRDYKQMLRGRLQVVESILGKLKFAQAA